MLATAYVLLAVLLAVPLVGPFVVTASWEIDVAVARGMRDACRDLRREGWRP